MNDAEVGVRRIGAAEATARADALAQALAELLIDCVEGGASVGFMLPLLPRRALAFWRGVVDGAARGERVLLVAEDREGRVVGTVQLVTAQPDNQTHRADAAHADFSVVHAFLRVGVSGSVVNATM